MTMSIGKRPPNDNLLLFLAQDQKCQIYYAMYQIERSSNKAVKFSCATEDDQIVLDIGLNEV